MSRAFVYLHRKWKDNCFQYKGEKQQQQQQQQQGFTVYSFTFVIKYFISVMAEFPVRIDYIIKNSPCQHLKVAYKEQAVVLGFHWTPLDCMW